MLQFLQLLVFPIMLLKTYENSCFEKLKLHEKLQGKFLEQGMFDSFVEGGPKFLGFFKKNI